MPPMDTPSAPTFTLSAEDPLAPGLLRYWIGAAKAKGGYPVATIRRAEETLKEFEQFRQRQRRRSS